MNENRSSVVISVVIPVRNRQDMISRCIASALEQTHPPAEIILVDDASSDRTREVVRQKFQSLVHLVTLPVPAGAQVARNKGIREASGTWIAFLDSDDEWLPTKLEKQVDALKQAGSDPFTVVYTNGTFVNGGRQTTQRVIVDPIAGSNSFPDLLKRSGPLFQSMLVSKEALQKIDYLDEAVPAYQEWDTSIRLSRHCEIVYIDEALFLYHRHAGERISKDKALSAHGFRYITSKFENDIKTLWGEDAWRDDLLQRVLLSLDAGLWDEADEDLGRLTIRSPKVMFLRMCRRLHLSPAILVRLKKMLIPATR